MSKVKRLIVKVDESKCVGCGECLIPCITGALKMVDGKCRLVDEGLCDGFGACISACPSDAISLEFREAEGFNEKHVGKLVIASLMKRYGLVETYIKQQSFNESTPTPEKQYEESQKTIFGSEK